MSDLDKLEAMWHGDDEDEPEPDSDALEPGYVPLRMPQFADRKESIELRWKNVIDEYGREACPYEHPRDEYIRNAHQINIMTLRYRWNGMGFEQMLLAMEHDADLIKERMVVQATRRKEMALPDTDDPEYKANTHRANVLMTQALIDQTRQELEENVEFVEQVQFVGGRPSHTTVERVTMSAASRTRKAKLLIDLQKHFRDMQGESVQRLDVTVDHSGTIEQLKAAMRENNYVMQTGQTYAEFEAANQARREVELTPQSLPEAVEGEVLPDNI